MSNVELPSTTASPIEPFLKAVVSTFATVAPERMDQLWESLNGVRVKVLDDNRWVCRAHLTERRVELSTRFLEAMWCYAYAVCVFYRNEAAGKEPMGLVETISNSETLEAMALLRWCLVEQLGGEDATSWPQELPQPGRPDAPPSETYALVNELFLMAVGFVLHHELAHLRLKHHSDGDSLDQERDADAAASDWILSGVGDRDQFKKRAIGVALALLVIVSRGIHSGDWDGRTHPRRFDRLMNVLERHVPTEHDAWPLIVAVLSLHTFNAGMDIPDGEFTSWLDIVSAFIERFAAEAEGK